MNKRFENLKGHWEWILLCDLKQHPSAAKIYSYRDIKGLADSISQHGMISNLTVNGDKFVLKGWRRKLANDLLRVQKLLVWVVDDLQSEDEEIFIVLDNATREKTPREKYGEAQAYRRDREKRQGRRTDLTGEEPVNMRNEIAEKMNIKPGELYNLLTIGDHNEQLLDSIDGVNTTLTSLAYKIRNESEDSDDYDAVVPISLEIEPCPTCHSHPTTRIVIFGDHLFYANEVNS